MDLFDSMKGRRMWTGNADAVLLSILTRLERPKWGIVSLETFKAAVAEATFDEIWNDVTQGTGWDDLYQNGLATIWLKRQIEGVSYLLILRISVCVLLVSPTTLHLLTASIYCMGTLPATDSAY
jgi:hypothetical protein